MRISRRAAPLRQPVAGFLTVLTFVFAGCSAPFTGEILAGAEDTIAPSVLIDAPANESYYSRTVLVSGTASDTTDVPEVAGRIVSLRYEIPAAAISESVEIDAEGRFSFTFTTSNFTGGTISVRVVATDTNGNDGIASLSLLYGGSDIASFAVIPRNQSVGLEWDPVPDATGYAVSNLATGESVILGPDSSDHAWTGLENGERYFFQLLATDGSGQTNVSAEVTAIPLSSYTLLPRSYSYADRIVLRWRALPGVDRYAVEKAEHIDGPYQKRFVTSATSVEDMLVDRDQFYYYRVYPESQQAIRSAPVEAVLVPYAPTGAESGSYFGPLDDNTFIIPYGNHVIYNEEDTDHNPYIRIADATDPSGLVQVGSMSPGPAYIDTAFFDETELLLFISLEELGVRVIDVSDPANPVLATMGAGSDPLLGEPSGDVYSFFALATSRHNGDTYLFGLGYDGSLYSARVDRAGGEVTLTPTASATGFATSSSAMHIHNAKAYVARKDSARGVGIDIIDVSNPDVSLPVTNGYSVPASTGTGFYPDAVVATDTNVFFGHRYTTAGWSRVRPLNSAGTASAGTDFQFTNRINGLQVAGQVLYVSAGNDGVRSYDISGVLDAGKVFVQLDTAGPALKSALVNGYLMVAEGIAIESFYLLPTIGYDSSPVTIGNNLGIYEIASIGTDAHLLSYYNFYQADLTDPASIVSLNLVAGVDGGTGLELQGDRQILVDRGDNLLTVVTPPGRTPIEEIASFEFSSSLFCSTGDYGFAVSGGVLSIFDTSDSSNFRQIMARSYDYTFVDIAYSGDYLYLVYLYEISVAPRESGILVLDISDPVNPVQVGDGVTAPEYVAYRSMELFDELIYVVWDNNNNTWQSTNDSDDSSGLDVYSIAGNPEQPVIAGQYTGENVYDPSHPQGWNWTKRFELVAVRGHLVVLSSGYGANKTGNSSVYEGRTVLLNATDPGNITKIKDILPDGGFSIGADFPEHLHFWRGDYLFVTGRQTFGVYEL